MRFAVVAQLIGTLMASAGVVVLFGLGWALLAAGLAMVGVGTLAEMRPPAPDSDVEQYTS